MQALLRLMLVRRGQLLETLTSFLSLIWMLVTKLWTSCRSCLLVAHNCCKLCGGKQASIAYSSPGIGKEQPRGQVGRLDLELMMTLPLFEGLKTQLLGLQDECQAVN